MDAQTRDKLYELKQQGLSYKAIGIQFGLSKQAVHQHLKRYLSNDEHDKDRIFILNKKDEIITLFNQGCKPAQIKEKYNLSLPEKTIIKYLNVWGCKTGKTTIPYQRKKNIQKDKQIITDMYNQGLTLTEISKRVGYSYSSILKYVRLWELRR